MKLKYILLIVIIGSVLGTILFRNSKYSMKAVNQVTEKKDQINGWEQKIVSGYPVTIALNQAESSAYYDGYRTIFIVIEEKYFTQDQLITIFTAISDDYEHPKTLSIYAYSDEGEVKSAIDKHLHDPPDSKQEAREPSRVDDNHKNQRKGFFAKYRREGSYFYGRRGEEISFTPNPNAEEVIVVRLKPKTYPFGELNSDLLVATMEGDLAAIKNLVSRGADVNAKDRYGDTALMIASIKGDSEIIRYLIDKGADVNTQNTEGNTALIYAAGIEKIDSAKQLLEMGANPQIQNNQGKTALEIAESHQLSKIAQLLKAQYKTSH